MRKDKEMKKTSKQNWEGFKRRTPIILGLSAVLCMPAVCSYASTNNTVAGESVHSILQGLLQAKS